MAGGTQAGQSGRRPGRHFLQVPGPTNVPDRVLRAIDRQPVDHRGPDFQALCRKVTERLKPVFKTKQPVVLWAASGTGAWEAALVNTLSPGDRVLMCETGHFAKLWKEMAEGLHLKPEFIPGDWRSGADPARIEEVLRADTGHAIKAVCVVHNESANGVASRLPLIRDAIDRAGHPALYLVDTISSLGSLDVRHDEWRIDVTIAGSQKGLMLPPGLSFNAVSAKALAACEKATSPRSYWDWRPILASNAQGFFPYTPATTLLYGLDVALDLIDEEGLENIFARHARFGEATRRAVRAWGLDIACRNPAEYSNSLTAVMTPEGVDADAVRAVILDRFDLSLGTGLTKLKGKLFRIGHLGDLNDLTVLATLAGVEMGLGLSNIRLAGSGVVAAMAYLADPAATERTAPAALAA